MPHEQNDLAYLMTAKICHDIAAPLGSLGMGLESIHMDETGKMLQHSYFLCNFKLRYYRLLMTSNINGPSLFDFVPLLNEYAKTQNINLHWSKSILESEVLKGDISRLLMGMVYLFLEPLVRGGDCTVDLTNESLSIESTGPICPLRDMYKKILFGEELHKDDINGRTIFPVFLMSLAKKAECNVNFKSTETSIAIEFK
ncbi:MAG: hypothetical protein KBD31_00955 [Proteobacteria bacterium]|nr:hypothetical protein [Pseudomonadota bacterium]